MSKSMEEKDDYLGEVDIKMESHIIKASRKSFRHSSKHPNPSAVSSKPLSPKEFFEGLINEALGVVKCPYDGPDYDLP
jgi:hypothetical protein